MFILNYLRQIRQLSIGEQLFFGLFITVVGTVIAAWIIKHFLN